MAIPAIDRIRAKYPQASITLICSKLTKEYFSRNAFSGKILLFDKRWPVSNKIRFSLSLRGKYDLVIDFKNSILPLIIGGECTPFFRNSPKNMHAKDTYIKLIERIAIVTNLEQTDFYLTDEETKKWNNYKLPSSLFVACASNALQKRYPYEHLKKVISHLKQYNHIIILGQESDTNYYKDILYMDNIINLVGKTGIHEVFYLLKRYAKLLLCVDSSILHIGSYLNIPTVAIFGQSSISKYGPWSDKNITITRTDLDCVPCNNPHCKMNHECMDINPDYIIEAVRKLLG